MAEVKAPCFVHWVAWMHQHNSLGAEQASEAVLFFALSSALPIVEQTVL